MHDLDLSSVVDLDRYPIADLGAPDGLAVINACQKQLNDTGLCLLPGFVRAEAIARMVEDAQCLKSGAHFTEHWRATPHGDGSPEAGAIPRKTRAAMSSIAYDRIGSDSGLRVL